MVSNLKESQGWGGLGLGGLTHSKRTILALCVVAHDSSHLFGQILPSIGLTTQLVQANGLRALGNQSLPVDLLLFFAPVRIDHLDGLLGARGWCCEMKADRDWMM